MVWYTYRPSPGRAGGGVLSRDAHSGGDATHGAMCPSHRQGVSNCRDLGCAHHCCTAHDAATSSSWRSYGGCGTTMVVNRATLIVFSPHDDVVYLFNLLYTGNTVTRLVVLLSVTIS